MDHTICRLCHLGVRSDSAAVGIYCMSNLYKSKRWKEVAHLPCTTSICCVIAQEFSCNKGVAPPKDCPYIVEQVVSDQWEVKQVDTPHRPD